ncbi:helix-turn-helix domain-containing protein [Streptomyces sp. NPDC056749]|uniref:helix-turn-helix domain-containing protein n=1 Tax=Streptomyces sp. NPDC056749 TaxID=3345936 RepID=UPI0036984EEF
MRSAGPEPVGTAEAVDDGLPVLHVRTDDGQADVRSQVIGPLRVTTVRGPALALRAVPGGAPGVTALVHVRGSAVLGGGGAGRCGPGDLVVCDGPFALRETEDFLLHMVQLPLHVLGPALDPAGLRGVHRPADSPTASLIEPLLVSLAGPGEAWQGPTADRLASDTAGLLTTLARETGSAFPPDAGSDRHLLTTRLRAYVNENLFDRGLSPESIAARHHISVRYLHKLFAGEGVTVSRWIQQRRLEECLRELGRRGGAPRPAVAVVGKRWGFGNAAHFSRSFRAAYGISPRDRSGRPVRPS